MSDNPKTAVLSDKQKSLPLIVKWLPCSLPINLPIKNYSPIVLSSFTIIVTFSSLLNVVNGIRNTEVSLQLLLAF